jgi:hypothetical protein
MAAKALSHEEKIIKILRLARSVFFYGCRNDFVNDDKNKWRDVIERIAAPDVSGSQ